MRILVGVDGGPQEPAALMLAAALARAERARITLVHAYGRRRGEGARAIVEGARRWLGAPRARTRLVAGPAAVALRAAAAEERAEVLVLGSAHRGPVGRTVLGGTGDRVVHGAPCAVAVAPRDYERARGPLRRVAVAFDGRDESRAALEWATRLAFAGGGEVVLLTVLGDEPDAIGPEQLDEVVDRVPDGVGPTAVTLRGPVARALADAAAGADLLVAGSRGHGPLGQLVLGSVTRRLMRDAPVPLVVLPRSALAATGAPGRPHLRAVGDEPA
jgi:nucleotide-binding universal stress UspA family protein